MKEQKADICLILEGTYPYVSGGVSSWAHDIITHQPDVTFSLICIIPPKFDTKKRYDVPDNVIHIQNITLQDMPKGGRFIFHRTAHQFYVDLEEPVLQLFHKPSLIALEHILRLLRTHPYAGKHILIDSKDAWHMLLRMYNQTLGESCFIDYFWSWRALIGGFFSVLLAPLPEARCYHSICTGYAGLLLARAHLEKQAPCMITEHGIYTNERCMEIASADWLDDGKALNFNLYRKPGEEGLRDFWMHIFISYSKLCYSACDHITTLFKANHKLQLADGAAPEKLKVIANGIDYDRYSKTKKEILHAPVIALIGRVVPIKDIKTFIRVCDKVRQEVPHFRGLVIGPYDEDVEYYAECKALVEHMDLEDVVIFTGKVDITHYLGKIDILALTSLSEAQPLVILEAGAAGVPSVATDVGSCRELIYGRDDEHPALGAGGVVTSLANPASMARAIVKLLQDKEFYQRCSDAIQKRVKTYYHKDDMHKAYRALYDGMIAAPNAHNNESNG